MKNCLLCKKEVGFIWSNLLICGWIFCCKNNLLQKCPTHNLIKNSSIFLMSTKTERCLLLTEELTQG